MSDLLDHEITERLHQSARSLVYRARAADGTALIVKRLDQDFPSFQQLAQFKREYAIARRCRHPGVVHALVLQFHDGRWMMIHEDVGGLSLDRVLQARVSARQATSQSALALDDFFDIASQLCAALEEVHRHGVIHRDINPSNLVWNKDRRLLQLIDFGIACELRHGDKRIVPATVLEGTLRYMAPEQTGRMNREVDYRADFYSLGATLYELLVGAPPFDKHDEMELVHCHIAQIPDWSHPALAVLPGSLLTIIQRLLEKDADQRYQSLQGLHTDLESCRAATPGATPGQWRKLSAHDGRFLVPQTLHGREEAIAALLAAFERSADGSREVVLVRGYSGVGKSALVNEAQKPILARRGCFLTGKCNQFQRDLPYASLIQAFQELVSQLLGEPEHVLRHWASRLRGVLGSGLGVMVELIPRLALIVGPTDAVPAVPPAQARLRLDRIFPRFAGVFATRDHPLVLFLDDLQWADAATLRMIELFMVPRDDEPGRGHMLFIGAYRDNEANAALPLAGWRDKLLAGRVPLSSLVLEALTESQVAQVVAATVRVPVERCSALVQLCFRKTAGNPFFLNQFLGTIHDAGHLCYRASENCWDWDLAAIEQADYADNVVELLLDKIRCLPETTQRLMQLAASIGSRFALDRLALTAERPARETQQALLPALAAGLIQPLDGRYKHVDADGSASDVVYRFLHDRVQQAAYQTADAGTCAANHLHIGRLMLMHATAEEQEAKLFLIVEQLNAGRALIVNAGERAQLAQLNQRAGARARRCAAFNATLAHMRIGLELLPGDAHQTHAGLWFNLQLGEAEAAYLCGQFDVAETIYPLVRARSRTPLEQVRCVAVQAHQYQLQGRLLDAIAVLRDGLAQLGILIPHEEAQLKARFDELFADIEGQYGARPADAWLLAGEMHDREVDATLQLMHGLWMAAYYAGQQDLSALIVLSMTRLSMQHGTSDFSPVAYVAYAMLLASRSGDLGRGYDFGAMALALARGRANLQARIQTTLMFAALTSHWTQHLRRSMCCTRKHHAGR